MLLFQRADRLSKKANQVFVTFSQSKTEAAPKIAAAELAKLFSLNLQDELAFFLNPDKPAKSGEIFEIPVSATGFNCARLNFVSIGQGELKDLRLAGAAIGRKLRGKNESAYLLAKLKSDQIETLLISTNLGYFQWNLKSGTRPVKTLLEVSNIDAKHLHHAQVKSSAVNRAREMIHTPSNIKNPEWIAKQAKRLAAKSKASRVIKVDVKSGAQLRDFGGLRAVGGSAPKPGPRFIEITYTPRKAKTKHVVLVGKGITYDTGGISLKRPYDIMIPMKSDMAGVAACLAAISALPELNVEVKVTALLMCAENAISATAQRPGDVIKHYGGKTVEVLDTDAEGRLVLADGLAYAVERLNPDYLLDIATLTGSATLGLGKQYAALYSRNPKWVKELVTAGEKSGDRVWHMPLIDDYQLALESDIADLNHTADKGDFKAGSVTAALFLEQFVSGANWAHLDIAGVGRAESDAGENPKGGTGWGVRLILEWLVSLK